MRTMNQTFVVPAMTDPKTILRQRSLTLRRRGIVDSCARNRSTHFKEFFFSFFFPCFLQRGIDARLLSRCFKDIVVKGFCEDGQQMQITT